MPETEGNWASGRSSLTVDSNECKSDGGFRWFIRAKVLFFIYRGVHEGICMSYMIVEPGARIL